MNGVNTNIPKLRFPEYWQSGAWDDKPLNQLSTSIFDGTHQTPKYTLEGIPFFSVENLVSGKSNKFISRKDYLIATSKNKPEKGDVLITRIGNIGFSAVINWDYEFSIYVTLAVIKKTEKFDSYYLHSYLQSERYQTEIRSKSLLNAAPCKINMDELRKTRVLFPSLKEQQKIADCFSSIDELITVQNQKIETLKAHKKGLKQQLFPCDGETVPTLRFPEFRDTGEWQMKPLGDVAEIITGSTPKTAELDNYGGDKLFVSPADISDERYISQTKKTLSVKGFTKTRHVQANSILFVCIGSTIGKIAQNKVECATNQQINAVVPKKSFSGGFLYFYLDNEASKIAGIAGRQAVPIINKTLFSSVLLSFPTYKEQQKIADFLSSIDELISTKVEKIKALKTHKKGLMQQLFPSMDEGII